SGNALAPHLHFHVMDTPSPLASNGLPYSIDAFQVTGATPTTEAFDNAEANGTPLAVTPLAPLRATRNALPLDQREITFDARGREMQMRVEGTRIGCNEAAAVRGEECAELRSWSQGIFAKNVSTTPASWRRSSRTSGCLLPPAADMAAALAGAAMC